MKKFGIFILVTLLVGMQAVFAQEFGDPIPHQSDPAAVEAVFIGSAAEAKPLEPVIIPPHPFMADNGENNLHNDAYMSDTYTVPGPLGHSPEVVSSYLNGDCVTIAFDQQGRLISACLNLSGGNLFLLDPVTLAPLITYELPAHSATAMGQFPSGSYFYLDHQDHVILPTVERTIWELAVVGDTFDLVQVFDLTEVVPEGDVIGSVLPDYTGRMWFVTHAGIVGTLDPATGATATLPLEGEAIANSFAVDETGGVFIASDYALYRFDADDSGAPVITWRETYDRGSQMKPGQVSQGTGTTPTLMGDHWVAITDNAEPQMHVLVYYRGLEQVEDWRLLCEVPVFAEGASATENSLIATETSIIVENNYGYRPLAVAGGKSTEPGITRIDLTSQGCEIVWTSEEQIPSVVSKLSLATGLIYTYTKEPDPDALDAWYFTAIDFETGETIFKQFTGTSINYNNHYSGVHLGADGTAYIGVIGGMVAVRDSGE